MRGPKIQIPRDKFRPVIDAACLGIAYSCASPIKGINYVFAAYGASLKALTMIAAEHGYSLVWVVPKLDAFFVRDDLIQDGTDKITCPYKKWADCTNIRPHQALKDREKAKIYLDYEVFTSSNGDVEASKRAAYKTCMTYLAAAGFSGKANRLLRLLKKYGNRGKDNTLPVGARKSPSQSRGAA